MLKWIADSTSAAIAANWRFVYDSRAGKDKGDKDLCSDIIKEACITLSSIPPSDFIFLSTLNLCAKRQIPCILMQIKQETILVLLHSSSDIAISVTLHIFRLLAVFRITPSLHKAISGLEVTYSDSTVWMNRPSDLKSSLSAIPHIKIGVGLSFKSSSGFIFSNWGEETQVTRTIYVIYSYTWSTKLLKE